MSKGRLAEHSDVKTLCFNLERFASIYNKSHRYHISKDDIKETKSYIRTDLAQELGLQDLERDKEYADWEDIKIMVRYMIAEDPHAYNNNRFRAQLVLIYLLVSESGERPGAIVRSESYRKEEVAICYGDIELFLRPASSSGVCSPQFKLQITYNNRKNERKTKDKYVRLVVTYYQRTDLAHCVIAWFLALAFLDDAFDGGITSPSDLFNRHNPGPGETRIHFKRDKLQIPILRRMRSRGSTELSPNLPWSCSGVTSESQRVVSEAGFEQRFTFYNVRRTMGNMLEDDSLLNQALDNDEELRSLVRARYELQTQLDQIKGDPEQGYNKVTVNAALEYVRRAVTKRRKFLKNNTREDFRKEYFKNPEYIRSQYPSVRPPERDYRSELVSALYPERVSEGSALVAIEAIIAHCRSVRRGPKKGYHKLPHPVDSSLPTSSEAEQDTSMPVKRKFTAEDTQYLVHLRKNLRCPWAQVQAKFPGWSIYTLRRHFRTAVSSPRLDNGLEAGQKCLVQIPDSSDCITKNHLPGTFEQQQNPKKRPHSASSSPPPAKQRKTGPDRPGSPAIIIARAVYNVELGREEWVDV
ncbi:hypothetical protein OIDMADRAFT_185985 [Oidiodendron maius Zn]|uniref:Myb-like domain-containing protein n=1 Tax=Oidiodendron maius (strain Zn) TaxID=913774 RepID=A0A0C3HYT5_OIDMZ|nr:hypothetical protein OIDMADRAFT_185985 [Oidiodendron maius Zn]